MLELLGEKVPNELSKCVKDQEEALEAAEAFASCVGEHKKFLNEKLEPIVDLSPFDD